jgi:hypothetical protein
MILIIIIRYITRRYGASSEGDALRQGDSDGKELGSSSAIPRAQHAPYRLQRSRRLIGWTTDYAAPGLRLDRPRVLAELQHRWRARPNQTRAASRAADRFRRIRPLPTIFRVSTWLPQGSTKALPSMQITTVMSSRVVAPLSGLSTPGRGRVAAPKSQSRPAISTAVCVRLDVPAKHQNTLKSSGLQSTVTR